MGVPSNRVQSLNDVFRQTFAGGKVLMTTGVASLSETVRYHVIRCVRTHSSFTPDNDPHDEHDFGSFEVEREKFFWKIDYYDPSMSGGSEDPGDPSQTVRVLTIMRAEEY